MSIELLQKDWFNLLEELQVERSLVANIGASVFTELVTAHTDTRRHYHNLNHVKYLLELADSVRELVKCLAVIKLAAWFHDYVYDSQAQDNEFQSAIYAKQALTQLRIDPHLDLVEQIILSTQKHHPLIDCMDNWLFLDLDLAILGEPQEQYWQYAKAIRKEYSCLSDRNYQQGRKQVLTNFSARERIYYTDYFFLKLEKQARANIDLELKLLNYRSI